MALLRNCETKPDGTVVKAFSLNSHNMKPRPVLRAIRTGDINEQGTQQQVSKDDVVVMCTIKDGQFNTDVLRVVNADRYQTYMSKITGELSDMSKDSIPLDMDKLALLTDEVMVRWLRHEDESRMLPEGFGWDGKHTRYEAIKLEEFENLFDEVQDEFVSDLVEWAMLSPRENVNHDWDTAYPIPSATIYLPYTKDVVMHYVILWKGDKVSLHKYSRELQPAEGLHLSKLTSPDVTKAIVGTVVTNKFGNNVRWKLYK